MKNSLISSLKSMKMGRKFQSGITTLAKILKLRTSQFYIILGLITVILVSLGLGTKREGFDSMLNASTSVKQIVDNMNGAINDVTWNSSDDKVNFINNINYWFEQKMRYLVQQGGVDLQIYDTNLNNKIYQLNPALLGTKDIFGTLLPMYRDDNMDTPLTPEFLQQYTLIDIRKFITQDNINMLRTQIENKINNFSTMDPGGQTRLYSAFKDVLLYADKLGSFLFKNPLADGAPNFAFILSQGTMAPTPFAASSIFSRETNEPRTGDIERGGTEWWSWSNGDRGFNYGSNGHRMSPVHMGGSHVSRSQMSRGYTEDIVDVCSNDSLIKVPLQCINKFAENLNCYDLNVPMDTTEIIPVSGTPYNIIIANQFLDLSQVPNLNWGVFKEAMKKVILDFPNVCHQTSNQYRRHGQCSNDFMTNVPLHCINSLLKRSDCAAAALPLDTPDIIPVPGSPYNLTINNNHLDLSEVPKMNWGIFKKTLPQVISSNPSLCEQTDTRDNRRKRNKRNSRNNTESINNAYVNPLPGSSDLYMLKTEATPPSNPPGASRYSSNQGGSNQGGLNEGGSNQGGLNQANTNPSPCQGNSCKPSPVPPCPPCERCPEPAFDCKRVPNYNSASINQYLPQPVLADFSQFGM
jgi:hypothetical protein